MKAAIDIGSNSVRIAFSDGTTRSVITQLALGLNESGRLSPRGVQATVETLGKYAAECAARGCGSVTAFATEAVRKAADGKDFCARVKAETGLTVTVLSGEQEAALALAGVTKPDGAVTVCDLGGGSLEVICSADGKTPSYVKSLPLGVVVLKNMFDGDFRRAIDGAPALVAQLGEIPPYPVVICGGSACNIAAAMLDLKTYDKSAVSTSFSAKQLDDFMPVLLSRNLKKLRPITEKRADTIPYGAILIQALLNHIGATSFFVSDAGNLEAVLKDN